MDFPLTHLMRGGTCLADRLPGHVSQGNRGDTVRIRDPFYVSQTDHHRGVMNMASYNLRKFWIVFGVGAMVGGLSTLAIHPQPLTAAEDNVNGQKFEALKLLVDSLKTTVELQSDILSGFSRGDDGSLRIADKTRMFELLVECSADADTQSPGLTVCGPAVFESSRMDASRVVLNGNGDFDPAVLVSLPTLPMPRSAIETNGGRVNFMNSRVSISADETLAALEGEGPLLDISMNTWNSITTNPLFTISGGPLKVASGPDQGHVTIGPGEITAIGPSGSRAILGTGNGYSKIELLVQPNGGGQVVSRALLQANGGETPGSLLDADEVTAGYIFGTDIRGFSIREITGTDNPY